MAEVVGRAAELDAVRAFLARVRDGPAALVLEGEAGIGKTTVWQEACAIALEGGFTVLQARPTESEAALPFAVLIDLFDGVLDEALPELAPPQARALEAALLRAELPGAAVDQLSVSLAALALVRVLASTKPLVLAIDDLPWLDAPSARVLVFALRRLEGEPVGVLATRRSEHAGDDPLELSAVVSFEDRLEIVGVGPLSLNALDLLLRDRLGLALPRPRLEAVLGRSGGNPLYALELGRAMADGFRLVAGDVLPVSAPLQVLVDERVDGLDAGARSVLLDAAALSRPTVELFAGRAAELHSALASGLLEREGRRLRYVHPLFGSAVYGRASAEERRDAHVRLARELSEPEERAVHLALAADAPDESVAVALEEAAECAVARGALDAAGQLMERARLLTPDALQVKAQERAIAAAECFDRGGDTPRSRSILIELIGSLPPGERRARALLLLAEGTDDVQEWVSHCRQALEDAAGHELILARAEMLLGRGIGFGNGDFRVWEQRTEQALVHAERVPPSAVLVEVLTELSGVRFFRGHGVQRDLAERAIALEEVVGEPRFVYQNARTWLGLPLFWAGELDEAREILIGQLALAGKRGDFQSQAQLTTHLADLELRAGDWGRADVYANDAVELGRQLWETMEDVWFSRSVVDAHLGRVEAARTEARRGVEEARRSNDPIWENHNSWVLGFLELSGGNVRPAAEILRSLVDELHVFGIEEWSVHPCAPDAVEALVGLGELDEAEAIATELLEQGERLDRAWALATASRGQALINSARGESDAALAWIDRALLEHRRMCQPFELGRTHLVHGTVLRRMKRRGDAKRALEEALAIFERLPAPLWAAKAREEVRRLGLRPSRDGGLTDTEQKVAELVAAGHTNREVAGELFLSVKTVEANLSRIYRKLGVRSRTELARTIGSPSP